MRAAIVCVAIAAAVGGCRSATESIFVRDEAYVDLRPHLRVYAQKIRTHAPPTRWERTIDAQEVDTLRSLRGDRVLVGLTELTHPAAAYDVVIPRYSDLAVVSSRDGSVLWRTPREGDEDVQYHVLQTFPAILVLREAKRSTTVAALDPDSGAKRWEAKLRGHAPRAHTLANGDLAVATGNHVGVLDGGSGRWTWQGTMPSADVHSIVSSGTGVAFVGKRHMLTNRGTEQPVATAANTHGAVAIAGGVVTAASGRLDAFGLDGRRRWTISIPGEPSLTASGQDILVETQTGSGSVLAKFSGTTGQRVWSRPIDGPTSSGLIVNRDRACASTARNVLAIDPQTGVVLQRHPISSAVARDRLPDHVFVTPDGCAVTGETFSMGLRFDTPGEPWSVVLDRALVQEFGEAGQAPATKSSTRGSGQLAAAGALVDVSNDLWRSQQRSRAAAAQARAVGNDAAASGLDARADAEADLAIASTQAALVVGAGAAGQAIGGAIRTAGVERARRARIAHQFKTATTAAAFAIQSHYWVRPVTWKTALGVVVVDLRSGQWVEVPTQVREATVRDVPFYDTHFAAIAAGMLVTKGVSLDPQRWQREDQAFAIITAKRALLGYAVEDLPFKPASDFPARAWSAAKP